MFAVSVSCALFVSSAFPQVIEIRDYRGKQIGCVRSGLKGFGRSCGTGNNYETVFIASVVSARETTDAERQLQLVPEEVFFGNADGLLTVNTNQGACLGDFQAGDKWLFYLQRDTKTEALLLSYGSPTKPIADAQKEIALLRRLVQMDDSGLILGQVTEPIWNENKWERDIPVPNHRVVARQQQSGREYAAFTDGDGNYEFEPLPPGAYHLSANASEGLRAAEGDTVIRPRSCRQVGFALQPDGRISGQVIAADGKPAKSVQVAVVPVSTGTYNSLRLFLMNSVGLRLNNCIPVGIWSALAFKAKRIVRTGALALTIRESEIETSPSPLTLDGLKSARILTCNYLAQQFHRVSKLLQLSKSDLHSLRIDPHAQ